MWLLARYSDAYASNQYRALQQFFRWLAEEEQLPDRMALGYRLSGPTPTDHMCAKHLRDSLRVVTAFEGPHRAWILLVGRHDDQDPVPNVYAELYRLLGVEPPVVGSGHRPSRAKGHGRLATVSSTTESCSA
ncbi:MAG: hypothetical protein ACRDOU_23640 [Streptosporangiaceae bacterium]